MSISAINLSVTKTPEPSPGRGADPQSPADFGGEFEQAVESKERSSLSDSKDTTKVEAKTTETQDDEAVTVDQQSQEQQGDGAESTSGASEQASTEDATKGEGEQEETITDEVVIAVPLEAVQQIIEQTSGGESAEQPSQQAVANTEEAELAQLATVASTTTEETASTANSPNEQITEELSEAKDFSGTSDDSGTDQTETQIIDTVEAAETSPVVDAEFATENTTEVAATAVAKSQERQQQNQSTSQEQPTVAVDQDSTLADNTQAPTGENPNTPEAKPAVSTVTPQQQPHEETLSPEVEQATTLDSPTTDAEPTVGESRERPAPATTSFQSYLERTTGPIRQAATTDTQQIDTSRIDPARFVSRVQRAFEAAESRGGTVQLRLSPPELGAMRIELNLQQNVMTAKLETETAAARNLLLDNLPALRDRLAAQEIRVDKFEVDVRQQDSGGPDWQAGEQSRDRGDEPQRTTRDNNLRSTSENATNESLPPRSTDAGHDGEFSAVA